MTYAFCFISFFSKIRWHLLARTGYIIDQTIFRHQSKLDNSFALRGNQYQQEKNTP